MNNLDDLLRQYRISHRLSQAELAEKLNIRRATLADWERRASFPSFENLKIICDKLAMDISKISTPQKPITDAT